MGRLWKAIWLFWALAAAMEDEEDGRLPAIIRPSSYRITLFPVLEQNERLCGHVWIDLTVVKAANFVLLNAVDLNILEAVIESGDSPPEEDPEDQKLVEDLCRSGLYESQVGEHMKRTVIESVHVDAENQQVALLMPSNVTLKPGTRHRLGLTYLGQFNH